ncbi:MAG TPA: hypothetical protein VNO30_44610 [Kofleriaceae bacterium]|nr:hypothetical protein [Kofleriaceae bacterium]
MRYWISALALLAAAGGTASAQVPPPEEQPPPTPPTEPTPPGPTEPTPPAPPAPPVAKPPRPVESEPPPPPPAPALRPTGVSFGIGLGYQLPTSLQTPNITSVRLRLSSGLTLEPRVVLARSTQDVDTGPSATDEASELGFGVLARYPIARRGRVDLELLGGFNVSQEETIPQEDDMDLTITTFTGVYGIAVGTWINRHLQVSLAAVNPIVTNARRNEQEGPGIVTVTTTRTYGLIFDPSVTLMVHLYH